MPIGKCVWWNAARGFGFLAPDNGDPDVFVHASSLPAGVELLREHQRVSFEIGANRRTSKPMATNVVVID